MYASFFGLKHEPFSIAPDPRYLYMSKRHREALAHLLYGVKGGGGFVLLSGEIGAGKTTVCRCFLEQIPKRTNVGYIFNPKLTVLELLKSVCDEFGIAVEPRSAREPSVKDYVDALNDFLLKTHAVGQNNVLIIDEAQMLSAEVLEQLRLLTNLETNERKLLQIVLIGQPELRTMLARPELEQLAQRVIARFHLKALSPNETVQYIRHRLAVAGLTRGLPFDREAMERIQLHSRGVPRRINLLCDRAMLGAYAKGTHRIGRDIVDKAAVEVFGRSEPARIAGGRPARTLGLAIGLAAVAALAVWVGYLLIGDRYARGPAVAAAPAAPGPAASASAGTAKASGVAASAATGTTTGTTMGAAISASAGARGASAGTGALAGAPAASGIAAAAGVASAAAAATSAAAASATPLSLSAAAPNGDAAGVRSGEAPKYLAAADLRQAFATVWRDEKEAWRELGALWNLELGNGDPCEAAQRQQVRCFKGPSSLEFVRRLGRPGIVNLRDDSGRSVHALLVGLTDQGAMLQMGGGIL